MVHVCTFAMGILFRESDGLGFADMHAHMPTLSKSTGRYRQSFTKAPCSSSAYHSGRLTLDCNERVFVSHQDGSKWAIAVGTVLSVEAGPEVRLDLDNAVSHTDAIAYRIDQAPSYAGTAMASSLAEFCLSDSERCVSLAKPLIA